jgi:hypothetical protein
MTSQNDNSPCENDPSHDKPTRAEPPVQPGGAELEPPQTKAHCNEPHSKEKHWIDYATVSLELIGLAMLCVYAGYTIKIYRANKQSADAATSAAKTAADSLVLAQRPWIKIKHRIVQPLTFNVMRWKGPIASMVVEDTLENVGQSVALNVFSWEDVIPVDFETTGYKTAQDRQTQWCETNRHQTQYLSGNMLFPKDPFVQNSGMGPFMDVVNKMANANTGGLHGRVAFVMVGCVVYRSSFEPPTAPAHVTKFMYLLGIASQDGAVQPYIEPVGVADKLRLISFPYGFSAD